MTDCAYMFGESNRRLKKCVWKGGKAKSHLKVGITVTSCEADSRKRRKKRMKSEWLHMDVQNWNEVRSTEKRLVSYNHL
jgi:hypothetical protein